MERILRLLGIGMLALAAQSALVTLSPVRDALPDLVIAAVLFLATTDLELPWGLGLALVIGYFFDLLSGIPVGVHCLAFQIIYLAGRSVQRRFFLAGVLFDAAMGFAAVWLVAVTVVLIRFLGQDQLPDAWGPPVLQTLLRAAGTAVLAPAVGWLGRRTLAGRRPPLATRQSPRLEREG